MLPRSSLRAVHPAKALVVNPARAAGKAPFVLTGATSGWPALEKWKDLCAHLRRLDADIAPVIADGGGRHVGIFSLKIRSPRTPRLIGVPRASAELLDANCPVATLHGLITRSWALATVAELTRP